MSGDLWKYCTDEQCKNFLLSMKLTGNIRLSDEKCLALLYGLSNHAEDHYTLRKIPKRTGGFRILHEPDPLLKYIQRQILRRVLSQLPVSECARAYVSGISLRENALPHVGKEKILKLDIHDFFGNISYIQVYQHAFPETLFPPSVRTLLTNLCCLDSTLPQGAPTSPCISNLVRKPFDDYMRDWCRKRQISYTRYCDDMTFSGSFDTHETIHKVSSFLLRLGFELNGKKTFICTRSRRQEVTGLIVNDHVQTSREYRRELRKEWHYIRKYGIKEHLKHIRFEGTPDEYLSGFSGRVAHVLASNPDDTFFLEIKNEFPALRNSLQ